MKKYLRVFYSRIDRNDNRIYESRFFHTMSEAIKFISDNPSYVVLDGGPVEIESQRRLFVKAN